MIVKYNRVSTIQQSGDRFTLDTNRYDIILLDKISGSVSFSDRPQAKEIIKLVEGGNLTELVIEELSRLGRNTGDVIRTLEWLEENKINVVVRNIGLQSRPCGKKNPVWKMITSVMSSLYEMEVGNIKERTLAGRLIYVQRGGVLGRPSGSCESEKKFIEKDKSKDIIKYINKGRTMREISMYLKVSHRTIIKAKKIGEKFGLLENQCA
jgi:DNA invertase Pin-like site-specific DNA recombinase